MLKWNVLKWIGEFLNYMKIEELAVKAQLIASEPNGFDRTQLTKAEKRFAELLIKECANIATDCYYYREPLSTVSAHILNFDRLIK